MRSNWQHHPQIQWAHVNSLAAPSNKTMGPCEGISSSTHKYNGPKRSNWQQHLLMQWAHQSALAAPPRKIMGQSEVIGTSTCQCNGPPLGQSGATGSSGSS